MRRRSGWSAKAYTHQVPHLALGPDLRPCRCRPGWGRVGSSLFGSGQMIIRCCLRVIGTQLVDGVEALRRRRSAAPDGRRPSHRPAPRSAAGVRSCTKSANSSRRSGLTYTTCCPLCRPAARMSSPKRSTMRVGIFGLAAWAGAPRRECPMSLRPGRFSYSRIRGETFSMSFSGLGLRPRARSGRLLRAQGF